MDKEKAALPRAVIFILLALLWTGFIFGNSMRDGASSSIQSGLVRKAVEKLLDASGGSYNSAELEHIVRKTGHVVEYVVQAALSVCVARSLRQKMKYSAVYILFFSLATAVFDEYIQLFSECRGSAVSDVLLDFCGAVAGFLLINGFWSLTLAIKSKKAAKSSAAK